MPKIDFSKEGIPQEYKPPTHPIKLIENMTDKEVNVFVYQELFKIHKSNDSDIIKEMKKEDLYEELVNKSYFIDLI